MKPKLPHPLYHFEDDFTPRPKLVVPRSYNWPFLVALLVNAVIVIAILTFLYWAFTR